MSAMRSIWLTPLIVFAVLVGGCASTDDSSAEESVDTEPSVAPSTSASTTTSLPPQTDPTTPTTETALMGPPPECSVLWDTSSGKQAWEIVNDDVMGGRSEGDLSDIEGRLIFEGVINTNGGGFSSLRLPIELGTLASARSILLQAVSDGRSYMLTLDDQLPGRSQRVSHRADIEFAAAVDGSNASIVTIPIDAFTPAVFGQAVDDVPVQVDVVDEIGLMISDGIDGPFRIEVEWLAGCP